MLKPVHDRQNEEFALPKYGCKIWYAAATKKARSGSVEVGEIVKRYTLSRL